MLSQMPRLTLFFLLILTFLFSHCSWKPTPQREEELSRETLRWEKLSGEQQMLAIGRGLMSRPKLLMLDEPSLGIAPLLVARIFEVIKDIHQRGTTILLVEQNAAGALSIADHGYVLETGEVVLSGEARRLLSEEKIKQAYLGV